MAINWDEIAKQAIQKQGGTVKPQETKTNENNIPTERKTPGIAEAPVDYSKKRSQQNSGINWDDIARQAKEREAAKKVTPTYLTVEPEKKKSSILSKVAQAAKTYAKANYPTVANAVEAALLVKKRSDEQKANPVVPFGVGEQFQITEEDVKRNPNLKPVYDAMQVESTTKAGPTIRTSELAKKDIYPKIIPATAPASDEQLSLKDTASLTVKASSPAQVLSDAPITKKVGAKAKDLLDTTVYTLQAAESQFKSGPRGKVELLKGTAKGFLEAGLEAGKWSARGMAYTDLNPVTRKLKQEAIEKVYSAIDEQVLKIRPKEGYEEVFTVGKFVGDNVPYVVSDAVVLKAFKAMPVALQSKKMIQEVLEAGSWVATGQILHRPDDGSRLDRLLIDSVSYLGFRSVGLSGLGLKHVAEESATKALKATTTLKSKLSQASQDVITRLEKGENVFIDEIEHVLNEAKNVNDTGTVKIGGKDVTSNSQSQLENFVVNERKTHYSVNEKATQPSVTFPTNSTDGVRITANSVEEIVKLAEKFGQRFPVKTQRMIFDTFSSLLGKNFNLDEITQALTAYAVNKTGGNATMSSMERIVKELVDSIPNEIEAILRGKTGIGRGLSGRPERAWQQLVQEALDDKLKEFAPNLSDFIRTSAGRYDLISKELPTPKVKAEKEVVKEVVEKVEIKPTAKVETIDDSLKKQKKLVEGGVSQKEIEPIKQGIEGKPERKSRLYERMQKSVEAEFRNEGFAYTQMDLAENAQRAIKAVESRSSKEILDIVRGMAPSIEGVTDLRLGVALFHKAVEAGDNKLAAEAIQSTARRATRAGQEIASLIGAFDKYSAPSIIKDVIARRINEAKTRMRKVSESLGMKGDDIIVSESKNLKADIDKKVSRILKAQEVLDKLTCK